jgi:hypothetical protein
MAEGRPWRCREHLRHVRDSTRRTPGLRPNSYEVFPYQDVADKPVFHRPLFVRGSGESSKRRRLCRCVGDVRETGRNPSEEVAV